MNKLCKAYSLFCVLVENCIFSIKDIKIVTFSRKKQEHFKGVGNIVSYRVLGVKKMEDRFCAGEEYQVREGDTLYQISRRHQIPLDQIMQANPYVNVYNLQPGEWICIPRNMERSQQSQERNETTTNNNMDHTNRNGIMLEYVITGNETLEQVLNKFDVDLEELLKYNGMNAIGLRRGTVLRIPKKIDD